MRSRRLTKRLWVALLLSALSGCSAALDFDALSSQRAEAVDPKDFSCSKQTRKATVLCDDFETGSVGQRWTDVIARPVDEDAGVIAHDDSEARSPTHSLLTVVHSTLDPEQGDVALGVGKTLSEFEGKPFHLELEFDIKVEQFDTRPGHALIATQVTFGQYSAGWYAQLMLVLQLSEQGLVGTFVESDIPVTDKRELRSEKWHAAQPFPDDEWVHVRFAFDASNRPAHSHQGLLRAGEQTLFEGDLTFVPRNISARVELGAPWVDHTGGSQTWRLRYDNVLLNVTPL